MLLHGGVWSAQAAGGPAETLCEGLGFGVLGPRVGPYSLF